jgi:hypothetical protein
VHRTRHVAFRRLPLALAITLAPPVHADSGVGVDTPQGNALDPTAGATARTPDERGTSWLVAGQRRAPGGNLYECPVEPPRVDASGRWQGHGVLQIGAIDARGDEHNALWNRYADRDGGLILGLLDYTWERPDDGSYANLRASRIGDDDEYFQAVFGRAGSYKVQAFLRELPNRLSDDARSIWDRVGSNRLTLSGGLTPGASTPDQVAAVAAAAPARSLGVTREKQGIGVSAWLTPQWTAYANLGDERRKGARAYGGPFFFDFAYPGNGGVLETPRPVDDSTVELRAGLRHAGRTWRMDFGYQGSFYRDRHTRYTYEMPFAIRSVLAGTVAPALTTGQMSTEPDNDYHDLRATLTRRIASGGELSLSAAVGRMSQNDALIAPVDCQGVFGIGSDGTLVPGPANPLLHECADWNTPAALSRTRAGLRIDTASADARLVLQPHPALTVRAGADFDRQDYRGAYLAFNPLTGQYGYVAENGAQGSITTPAFNAASQGASGIWDPSDPLSFVRVRSLPLDARRIAADVGADWRVGERDTLGATFGYERSEPGNRERREVDDRRIGLTWVDRALDGLVLRANAGWRRRGGSRYDADPYAGLYSPSLPGYVPPPDGVPAQAVDALRVHDLADREEYRIDLMATIMPRDDMTFGLGARGVRRAYDAVIGRRDDDVRGLTLQWEWQPAPGTTLSAYYGRDRSRLRMAGVNDAATTSDPTLGGSSYPVEGRWWNSDVEDDESAGIALGRTFGRARFDADWHRLDAGGRLRYRVATPVAFAYFGDGFVEGNAFAPMRYRLDALTLALTLPLADGVALRLFDRYERADVRDWHHDGLDVQRVLDHRVYLDAGPAGYHVNLVGMLLEIRLQAPR